MRVALGQCGTFTQAPITLPLALGNGKDECHFPEEQQPKWLSGKWPVKSC
jgi:hypothetical protein